MKKEADFERLTRIILDEFKGVHDRFDKIETRFSSLPSEVALIRRQLDKLQEAVGNVTGYAKEIDHLLNRISAIEKHLGLTGHIKA